MITSIIERNAGHPDDGRAGFDRLTVDADTKEEIDNAVTLAEARLWHTWVLGTRHPDGVFEAVLYKQSDLIASWHDGPSGLHPVEVTAAH
jgi:hypothetical protein